MMPPIGSCLDERLRHVSAAAVTMMRSNGALSGAPDDAVADDHLDIVKAERLQPRPRRLGKRAIALDADHLAGEPRQDRRLVARAGADLEHAMLRLHVELLGHVGDDVGLADGLAAGDRQRAIRIGGRRMLGGTKYSRGTSSIARSTAALLMPRRRRPSRNSMRSTIVSLRLASIPPQRMIRRWSGRRKSSLLTVRARATGATADAAPIAAGGQRLQHLG